MHAKPFVAFWRLERDAHLHAEHEGVADVAGAARAENVLQAGLDVGGLGDLVTIGGLQNDLTLGLAVAASFDYIGIIRTELAIGETAPTPSSPMTLQRRSQIVELVHERGSVRVAEMAAKFRVSEVTIRSDLDQLEREGRLVRDRGGALPAGSTRIISSLPGMELRAGPHVNAKRRIAAAAASKVKAGDSLLLDAGTTVVEMVRHLSAVTGLTIVTNALNVVLAAVTATEARVLMLGGTVGRDSGSTLGPMAEDMMRNLVVDHLFLGAQAVDLEHGLTDTNIEIA